MIEVVTFMLHEFYHNKNKFLEKRGWVSLEPRP